MADAKRILIAAGGTGGHIYPALAIAKSVFKLAPETVIEFVGTPTGIESKIIPREGFKLNPIQIGRLNSNVSLSERLWTLLSLPFAILKGFLLTLRFRPDVVFGVGGYASGPILLAAALLRFRTVIWEPNAYPGMANRLLSPFVSLCLVVFKDAAKFLKGKNILQVPFPVRAEIENSPPRIARSANFRVLIFGGSQGSQAINKVVREAVARPEWRKQIEIVHQTGPADYQVNKNFYESQVGYGTQLSVHEYLHDMPQRYAWADLVIARSGAGTISELAACGKASILIPLPTAAENHQLKNAQVMESHNAAVLLEQKDLTSDRFIQEIVSLAKNHERLAQLEKNVRQFHESGVADKIARMLLNK